MGCMGPYTSTAIPRPHPAPSTPPPPHDAPQVGNAILPIPYAFAITGAVASTLIIVSVALSNVYTCRLLLRGATCTGAADYEQLAFAVGGKWFKVGAGGCWRRRRASEVWVCLRERVHAFVWVLGVWVVGRV